MTPKLRAALVAALRSVAAALEDEGDEPGPVPDPLLDLNDLMDRFGVGRRAAVDAVRSGALKASEGPRRRLLFVESDVRSWLTSRPARVNVPREGDPEDPLDAAIARGELTEARDRRRS